MAKRERLPRTPSRPRSQAEKKLLERIGRKVHKELHDQKRPVEWLAFESEVARSTIRRIFDAEWNVGILTLDRIAKGLGYKNAIEFLDSL